MAEFKLGRIRFVWQGDWATGQTYYKDDIVRYGGKTYLCVIGHAANTDFYADLNNIPTRWNQVSDGQEWKGDWTVDTYYKVNDIVKYGGLLYICNEGHQSALTLALGLEADQDLPTMVDSKWDIYAESFDYKGDWTVDTRYKINDVVKYGGNSYTCKQGHTSALTLSAGLEVDLSKWDIYAETFSWQGEWVPGTRYKINDTVTYGGTTYICNEGHTAAGTVSEGLEFDQSKWDYVNEGTAYKGTWNNNGVRYKVNDLVKYGAGIWICTAYHTSSPSTTFESDEDSGRWAQYVEGLEFENTWTIGTIYQPGDIVAYGGYAYQAKTNHTASGSQPPSTNTLDWSLYTTGLKFQGDWNSLTSYRVGDVIRLNGYTYVAVADSLNQIPPNLSKWERLNSGIRWQGQWQDDYNYVLGDAVRYGNSSYICILAHLSEGDDGSTLTPGQVNSRPDQDVSGTYWNLLSGGPEESVLTTTGDLVYYGGAGPTRLPIGQDGQVLRVNNGVPEWGYFGVVSRLVYVAPHGVNEPAPTYGLTLDKPWASVRYACERIEQGYENPNAGHLLKMNRSFIQTEVGEFVDYQIAQANFPFSGFTNPSKSKCVRDMGLLVDALAYDLTHGGNLKTREATLSYFDEITGNLLTQINAEKAQTIACIEYALSLIDLVLSNESQTTNYQTLNSVVNPVLQYVDVTYQEEVDAQSTINSLVTIAVDAITAGNIDNLAREDAPTWTINVKTGQYYETLPIIVPARTGVVGDELRGTRVSPAGSLIASNDKAKSVAALTYLQSITDNVILGTPVTPLGTGTQVTTMKPGSTGSTTAVSSVAANVTEMIDIVNNGLSAVDAFVYPDPTGYDTGYFNARRLILANKAFLVSEVSAWINAQILANTAPFEDFTYGGAQQTSCERDVGYIVDALVYDLTYGGNLETSVAARSYYSLGTFVETGEKAQALAVQARIKDIIDNIATGNTAGWTKTTGLSQDVSGTPGSAGAATFAQDRIQEIYDTINTGVEPTPIEPSTAWVNATLVDARTKLVAAKTAIQADAVQHVKKTFPTLVFNETLCSRDVGYIVDALGYDLMFGSNFRSIKAAMSYYRALTSTAVVLGDQKAAQLSMLAFLAARIKPVVAAGAVVAADLLWTDVIGYINSGTAPQVVGSNTAVEDTGIHNGAIMLALNKEFLAQEALGYINTNFFVYDSDKCSRDVGLIIEGVSYDLALGTNYNAVTSGLSYLRSYSSTVITDQKTETIAGINYAKAAAITAVTGDATSVTRVTNSFAETVDIITNGVASADALTFPGTSPDIAQNQIDAKNLLVSNRTFLREVVIGYINTTFPELVGFYDQALCSRDVGYIVDALCYDVMYGGNSATVKTALSYYLGASSLVPGQETETSAAIDKLSTIAQEVILNTTVSPTYGAATSQIKDLANPASAAEQARIATLAGIVSAVVVDGPSAAPAVQTPTITWVNSIILDKRNLLLAAKATIQSDTIAYINTTYDGYFYNQAQCARDARAIIDAMVYDLQYTGNYRSSLAARYYRNALTGSKLEDMYYVRNGCGLRNMTLTGLDGRTDGDNIIPGSTGLTNPNEFGTSRPLAGAYVSLDPGWGPNDYRAWTDTKSTYVQNVTTFGNGCTGQKIDGSLQAGGLDTIVSNDFTQVLSDGIGAWVTNLGRAELVSVFTYYNHIGYLSENGGKIRATNGNNSYGTFGSVAEGVDVTETPITGTVNNRNTEATVGNVYVSGDQVYAFEYTNAGVNYTPNNAGATGTYTISGAGTNAAAVMDEVRYGGVYEVRLTDPGDSSGPGGVGYITSSNLAQAGTTTQITLANTETATSLAYVGMSIYLTTGTGAGQYGVIATYSAPTKVATVVKESDGTSGWDHVIPGTAIEAALDVTTAYTISPRINIAAPTYTIDKTAVLPSSDVWTAGCYGYAEGTYSGVASTTGDGGSLATFNVTRLEGVYTVTLQGAGINYAAGDTLTIAGTNLGGTSANNITVTVTAVDPTNANSIVAFDYTGTAIAGQYVAVSTTTSTVGAYSEDGVTWSATTLPSGSWSSVAYGTISGVGIYVAVSSTGGAAASSLDGINWTVRSMPTTSAWASVTYGNGRFMAVATGSNDAAYSTNGTTWVATSALPGSSANWTSVTYGKGLFVAVASGSTQAASSANGTTWSSRALPSSTTWSSVTYGKNRFVAVASGGTAAAYSLNGTTWTASGALPVSATWNNVSYGNGVYYAVAAGSVAATSEDGINWTSRSMTFATPTITATSKDIIGTFTAATLPHAGYWTNVLWTGSKFVAVGHDNSSLSYAASSTDGATWSTVTIPNSGGYEYTAVAYNGTDKYVAFLNNDRDTATSTDGITWTAQTNALPAARAWTDAVFGGTKFVVVGSGGANPTAYSTDGTTWTTGTLANTTWTGVTYGQPGATAYFVAVSATQAAAYSTDGITWTSGNTLPSSDVWSSVAYGNTTFVTVAGDSATATTKAAYSTNGTTWTAATMPGAAANWVSVTYGGGTFMAFAYGSTRTAVSTDGITWTEGPAISSGNWSTSAYGSNRFAALRTGGSTVGAYIDYVLDTNYLTTASTSLLSPGDRIVFDATTFGGMVAGTVYYVRTVDSATTFTISASAGPGAVFVLSTGSGSMTSTVSKNYVQAVYGKGKWIVLSPSNIRLVTTSFGAKARARSYVSDNKLTTIWIQEPGGGYTAEPALTITDPNNTGADATTTVRIGNGVLASPTFTNRGTGYTSASVSVVGNGYADTYQIGTFVYLNNLTGRPAEGSNLQIAGIDAVWYRVVQVTQFLGTEGNYSARVQVSPAIAELESPEHGTGITLRRRYSQVRLTGHDFLQIGTGNQTLTNYPDLPLQDPQPANETVDSEGGRVFYTSTDQDGNFRVGGLFNVEQATGVATLNADAFNLAGLNELQLGSVALGGAGAIISEFSTDPFFTADSDNVVPTQRAIKAYISSQIGGGGSSLNVNSLTAGVIYIAGNSITTTTEVQININTKVNFTGGVDGSPVALNYFLLG